ncbi:hypothetical protein N7509_011550 [Penicillium cosmopolitanum]|uniref:Glycosyl transferase family 1 domain-containing protein n=1 Tax=Penicillium cosmopolitanum TaxID=1131564 RepID=A0A9W9VGF2_9EURO|nr:uncharacterized protein N7509_011550 [Penicillium cosmopolitanum]KAJ5378431.1 hypothetical protein N7509_011550 [Penicillium cosmopolitanum]
MDSDSHANFPSILKGKKILLATESWGPVNGVSRTTRSLVEYLRDNGVDLILVAPDFKGDTAKQSTQVSGERRLPGCALPYNPDLTPRFPGLPNAAADSPTALPTPVLLNFQTDLSAYSEIMLPAPLDRFGVWLLATVQGFLFRTSAVRTIFYPCSAIRGYLEGAGAPADRMVKLGRGVDTTLFTPDQRDASFRREIAPNGEVILLCVCRIAPEKGFEFLAQVAMRLSSEKVPFKLLIVGGNRNPVVESRVQRLFDPVRRHVEFTGFLTGAALARAYASADLFLHCSVTETFGLVVLEAMASGIPVIARDQGGPSDIILHGKTGYLVPPNDLEQFTSLTRQVARDTELRSSLSVAARQFADDTTWEKINRRAAWQMADALVQTDQEAHGSRPPRPTVLASAMEQFRLIFAVAIVYGMWLIAVVPLIVHGNRLLPRAWMAVRRQLVARI